MDFYILGYGQASDFIAYGIEDYLKQIEDTHLNGEMINRDYFYESPTVKEEPVPNARGRELGLANRYVKPQSFGKHWIV